MAVDINLIRNHKFLVIKASTTINTDNANNKYTVNKI